jgi:ribulose-phosphate 3-epimerase
MRDTQAFERDIVRIAPSILDSDLSRLGETLGLLESAGADVVHLDVMDGHFVPNISVGVPVVASARKATGLPLDVHLMIEQPDRYIDAFIEAGSDILTIHLEATAHPHRALQMIRNGGIRAGVALNPGTPVAAVRDLLPLCDLVLLMSVNPGFGGQAFIPETHRRLGEVRQLLQTENINAIVEVDGGVSSRNAADVASSGATMLVAGSAIFKHEGGVEAAISELRSVLRR